MPSTKLWHLNLFVDRWCLRDGVKLKPVVLSCTYGFRNNNMLHSVYLRQLVDLENKSCVRVPLVNIYRQSAWCRVWIFSGLKKKPFKCLVKVVRVKLLTNHLKGFFRPSWQQWFNSHSGNKITRLLQTITEVVERFSTTSKNGRQQFPKDFHPISSIIKEFRRCCDDFSNIKKQLSFYLIGFLSNLHSLLSVRREKLVWMPEITILDPQVWDSRESWQV